MSGLFARLEGCYIESNGNSDAYDVTISTTYVQVVGNTFISTASAASSRPVGALTGTALAYVRVEDNVFDNGTYGYSDYAYKIVTSLIGHKGTGNSFLRGADMTKPAIGTDDGYFAVPTTSGAAQIEGW
jgi:hypothetical protein